MGSITAVVFNHANNSPLNLVVIEYPCAYRMRYFYRKSLAFARVQDELERLGNIQKLEDRVYYYDIYCGAHFWIENGEAYKVDYEVIEKRTGLSFDLGKDGLCTVKA